MRENYNTLIKGEKVKLVPYKRKFVQKYHNWMQDSFLQEMTASEPLTLEGEYEMQGSWRDDNTKCTFILLDNLYHPETCNSSVDTEIAAMIGDVNMFLNDHDDPTVAELEIMIAETSSRGKGMGKEAVLMMMHYGVTVLNLTKFYVKINQINTSSLDLFKRLGFVEVNYVPAFEEYELQLRVGVSSSSASSNESATDTAEQLASIERNRQMVLERGSHLVYSEYAAAVCYED